MRGLLALLMLLAGLVVVTGTVVSGAQGGDPPWAGDLHDEMEREAQRHNAWVEREDPEFVGDRVAENERGTITVRGEAGGEAVYSFRTDEEMRVTDIGRGPARDETVRIFASKPALEDVLRSQNPAAAFGDAVAAGDVRVERVVGAAGHELALGLAEGALGVLGLGASAALIGALGVGTAVSLPGLLFSRGLSALQATVQRLLDGLKTVLKLLAHLVAAVEALQLLGFEAREKIRAKATGVRARLRAAGGSLRRRLSALDEMPEAEDRDRSGGEAAPQGEEGQ
jgi:hypothetical protein